SASAPPRHAAGPAALGRTSTARSASRHRGGGPCRRAGPCPGAGGARTARPARASPASAPALCRGATGQGESAGSQRPRGGRPTVALPPVLDKSRPVSTILSIDNLAGPQAYKVSKLSLHQPLDRGQALLCAGVLQRLLLSIARHRGGYRVRVRFGLCRAGAQP